MIDVFTEPASGTPQRCYSAVLGTPKSFAVQVEQVGGSGATWTVVLEGSLDGVNFTTILTHTDADPGDKQIMYSGAAHFPSHYIRARCLAVSLGTAQNLKVQSVAG